MVKLIDFIAQVEFDRDKKSLAEAFCSDLTIGNTQLSKNIANFFYKLTYSRKISQVEYEQFIVEFGLLNEGAKKLIKRFLFDIAQDIYHKHSNNLFRNQRGFQDLLNLYTLFVNAHSIFLESLPQSCGFNYPDIARGQYEIVNYKIPMAMNLLQFSEERVNNIYYPLHLHTTKEQSNPSKTTVYPYEYVKKIASGTVGSNTLLAIDMNTKSLVYLRVIEPYSPHAILASKIACFISSQHFSEEQLYDGRFNGSQKLEGYVYSVAGRSNTGMNEEVRILLTQGVVFPGLGIIDEVTNYLNEQIRMSKTMVYLLCKVVT